MHVNLSYKCRLASWHHWKLLVVCYCWTVDAWRALNAWQEDQETPTLHALSPPPLLTAFWQALSFDRSSPSGPPPSPPVFVHDWGLVEATPGDSLWFPVTGAEKKKKEKKTWFNWILILSAPSVPCTGGHFSFICSDIHINLPLQSDITYKSAPWFQAESVHLDEG